MDRRIFSLSNNHYAICSVLYQYNTQNQCIFNNIDKIRQHMLNKILVTYDNLVMCFTLIYLHCSKHDFIEIIYVYKICRIFHSWTN
jgi:hypothetical protein